MSNANQCKNCEKTFDESFNYCPNCGQETTDSLTIGVLFSNTISNYFSIDARFFKSLVPLMLQPGVLARRFVDGKRLMYLHPAQFYLFMSVVFFFIFSFSVRDADNQVNQALKKGFEKEIALDSLAPIKDSLRLTLSKVANQDAIVKGLTQRDLEAIDSVMSITQNSPNVSFDFQRGSLDSLIAINAPLAEKLKAMGMAEDANTFTRRFYIQMLKFYEKQGGGILSVFYDTIPIVMFFMLPLFALLLKLFYWKKGTFAHHMVFSFYFFTFLFTALSIIILSNRLFDLPLWSEILLFLSFVVYLMLALRNFYKSGWTSAFFKANTISFIYLLFIVPIAMVGIILASFMLY